jgi:hypothetical protein
MAKGGDEKDNSQMNDGEPDFMSEEEAVGIEEELEESLDSQSRAERQAVVVAADNVRQAFVGRENDPAILNQQLSRNGVTVINVQININRSDPQQNQALSQVNQQVAEVRQLVQAVHDGPSIGAIRCKYVLIVCGVLGGISAALAIFFTLKDRLSRSNSPPRQALGGVAGAPLSEPVDGPDAAAVTKFWLRNSEAEFWQSLADFVDRQAPRPFTEQLLFSQLTLDLANHIRSDQWVWQSPGDVLTMVGDLANTIASDGLSAAYRALPNLVYQGRPLTRAVAADLISRALISYWNNN